MKRITFVQHGDYREAYERLSTGGEENYYAQKHHVDYVSALAKQHEVTVVCVKTAAHGPMKLPNGVTAVGLSLWSGATPADVVRAVDATNPTHLICQSPMTYVLKLGLKRGWSVFPVLADSFEQKGLRHWWRHRQLAKVLNDLAIPWVANHGVNSCRSLARIGVDASKIVPFDRPAMLTPDEYKPRDAPPADRPLRLVYAGVISEDKGVGDIIEAIGLLATRGVDVSLTVLGNDADDRFARLAQQRGVSERIDFRGSVAHAAVVSAMCEHDAVIVSSRHSYPEGLPGTIYEALATRTPLIASDHPMFANNLNDGVDAVIYQAADPAALAAGIERLIGDAGLYCEISNNAAAAWRRIQLEVEWSDLIDRFLDGFEKHTDWLAAHSLANHSN